MCWSLNARKQKPKYPEAVPVSKEAGFMFPGEAKPGDVGRFVLHQHEAKRAGLHNDLRVEIGGQLQSWAVPQMMPKKGERKLAIGPTAHHGLEYYEKGTYDIPSPFYGAGTMRTAEVGTATLESMKPDHVVVRLKGVRGLVDGTYSLIKFDPKGEQPKQQQWLLQHSRPLKDRDADRAEEIYTAGHEEQEQSKLGQLEEDYGDFLDPDVQAFVPSGETLLRYAGYAAGAGIGGVAAYKAGEGIWDTISTPYYQHKIDQFKENQLSGVLEQYQHLAPRYGEPLGSHPASCHLSRAWRTRFGAVPAYLARRSRLDFTIQAMHRPMWTYLDTLAANQAAVLIVHEARLGTVPSRSPPPAR